MEPTPESSPAERRGRWAGVLQLPGVLLFLFIPAVLFLFVRHPEPVGASLAAGVALMVGHRFLARPHMEWARTRKCLWCDRTLPSGWQALPIATGDALVEARCCPAHREPAARFVSFLDHARLPLRLGIFVPLLALLGTLVAHALGQAVPLDAVTAAFQLVVGLTVNVAAWGYRSAEPAERPAVPFPAHNFWLLGIAPLVWIFRLVGIWWIVVGLRFFG